MSVRPSRRASASALRRQSRCHATRRMWLASPGPTPSMPLSQYSAASSSARPGARGPLSPDAQRASLRPAARLPADRPLRGGLSLAGTNWGPVVCASGARRGRPLGAPRSASGGAASHERKRSPAAGWRQAWEPEVYHSCAERKRARLPDAPKNCVRPAAGAAQERFVLPVRPHAPAPG